MVCVEIVTSVDSNLDANDATLIADAGLVRDERVNGRPR